MEEVQSDDCGTNRIEIARQIVLEYGWNATSYQILNPGFELWFSTVHRAVIGYSRGRGVLLVAGAPTCALDALASVCDEFESFARQEQRRVCYVCAESRLKAIFARSSIHSIIGLGSQPSWDPRTWPEIIQHRASLRAQVNRARNKGVDIGALSTAQARTSADLRRVLKVWLDSRRLPPLHFLVEPNVLDGVLTDRIILVAQKLGTPVAFLVASPIRARDGYLVELLARSSEAPNGSSELLINAAMKRFAEEGCRYATLGLVALAHAADKEIRTNPAWIRALMHFARAHANRFYNFQGLEQFRVKMYPDKWEPIYAISNEPTFSARTLYALGAAFSGIPPWAAVTIGMARAVNEEFSRLVHRCRS